MSSNSATSRSTAVMPASTPGDRATSRAAPRAWLGIVAVEVMSPDLAQVFRKSLRDQHVNVAPLALAESVVERRPSLRPPHDPAGPRSSKSPHRRPSVQAYFFAFVLGALGSCPCRLRELAP